MSNLPSDIDASEDKPEILDQQPSRKIVEQTFEQLEMLAMQRNTGMFEFAQLDKEQKDNLLRTISENEIHAYEFHTKKIEAAKEIELKKLTLSVYDQATKRTILIISIVAFVALTILILVFKEKYFSIWLTYIFGLGSGLGVSKIIPIFSSPKNGKNPITEEYDND